MKKGFKKIIAEQKVIAIAKEYLTQIGVSLDYELYKTMYVKWGRECYDV